MNDVASPALQPASAPEHDAPARRIGMLLVNLGSPDTPDAPGLRRYLKEFLSDPRVIEDQGLLWKLVLNGIVLPIRPRMKAHAYKKIWDREKNESPLKVITRAQAEKLPAALGASAAQVIVDWAMRYGTPSIAARLQALTAQGCDRILVVPLYPQYAAATTATVGDEVFRALSRMRCQPALRIAAPYYDDAVYIDALAASVETAFKVAEIQPEVVVASFHGIPQSFVDAGDPYAAQCEETVRLLRARLEVDANELILTYQSRFGRAQWLKPATDATLKELAKRGVKSVGIVMPGFSADCLETLEEIAIENARIFKRAGGEHFVVVPCLNDSAPGMALIAHLVGRELQGWLS